MSAQRSKQKKWRRLNFNVEVNSVAHGFMNRRKKKKLSCNFTCRTVRASNRCHVLQKCGLAMICDLNIGLIHDEKRQKVTLHHMKRLSYSWRCKSKQCLTHHRVKKKEKRFNPPVLTALMSWLVETRKKRIQISNNKYFLFSPQCFTTIFGNFDQ